MRGRAATATVQSAIKITLDLEPGIWLVTENDGREYSVTSLHGVVDADGTPHLAWPHGVLRRPGGQWSVKQYLLQNALPRNHPHDAWRAVPDAVRDLIEDAYLLELNRLPHLAGALT